MSAQAEALDHVADELSQLRAEAGNPSYAKIAEIIFQHRVESGLTADAARIARSTVYDAFKAGRSRIDAKLIEEIALALTGNEEIARQWRENCYAPRPENDLKAQREALSTFRTATWQPLSHRSATWAYAAGAATILAGGALLNLPSLAQPNGPGTPSEAVPTAQSVDASFAAGRSAAAASLLVAITAENAVNSAKVAPNTAPSTAPDTVTTQAPSSQSGTTLAGGQTSRSYQPPRTSAGSGSTGSGGNSSTQQSPAPGTGGSGSAPAPAVNQLNDNQGTIVAGAGATASPLPTSPAAK